MSPSQSHVQTRPFNEPHHDYVWPSRTRGNKALSLLSSAIQSSSLESLEVDAAFNLVPGLRDSSLLMAEYLGDISIPTDEDSPTLLSRCLESGFRALSTLGTRPISLQSHHNGFPLFLAAMLSEIESHTTLSIETSHGATWSLWDGPFLVWRELHQGAYSVQQVPNHLPAIYATLLKLRVMTFLVSHAELQRLSGKWDLVIGAR